jgi:hypothetical protein
MQKRFTEYDLPLVVISSEEPAWEKSTDHGRLNPAKQ